MFTEVSWKRDRVGKHAAMSPTNPLTPPLHLHPHPIQTGAGNKAEEFWRKSADARWMLSGGPLVQQAQLIVGVAQLTYSTLGYAL